MVSGFMPQRGIGLFAHSVVLGLTHPAKYWASCTKCGIGFHAPSEEVYRCLPKYILTYTYIYTYIYLYIHTYIHTYIPIYLPTYLHTYLHTYTYLPTYLPPTYLPTYLPIYLLTTYLPTYLPVAKNIFLGFGGFTEKPCQQFHSNFAKMCSKWPYHFGKIIDILVIGEKYRSHRKKRKYRKY